MSGSQLKCGKCAKPFATGPAGLSYTVQALGKMFHPGCFLCAKCNCGLAGKEYFEVNGTVQCANCTPNVTSKKPNCQGCKKPITDGAFTSAYNFSWHESCLVCAHCKKRIGNDGFFDEDISAPIHLDCLKE